MAIKVGINGYGRIGRNILRALYESGRTDIEIVAINDLGDSETNAHLTRYDTAHGPFGKTVAVDGDNLVIEGDHIKVFAIRNPAEIPWGERGVDVVLECTGLFTDKEKASAHFTAGAKKVLISAPAKGQDLTVVMGVNDQKIDLGVFNNERMIVLRRHRMQRRVTHAHHQRGAVRWDLVKGLAPGIVLGAAIASLGVFALLKGSVLAIVFGVWFGFVK